MLSPRQLTQKIRSGGSASLSRQTTQPTPRYTSPYLWPDALIEATRASWKSQTRSSSTKWRDERPGGSVHVDRDVQPRLGLEGVERLADLLHGLVAAVEGRAEDRDDADRVLVAELHGLLRRHMKTVALHRHEPHLDVPVVGELLPAHLD